LPSSFLVAEYKKYTPLLRISGALHLSIFDQPEEDFGLHCCARYVSDIRNTRRRSCNPEASTI
jgi:hypothetical protein